MSYTIPADRLRENDLIMLDGETALIVSAFVYRGEQRLKIVKDIMKGIESIELPENLLVNVVQQ